jgi:transposase
MWIIGCDYHPRFQQIAFVNTDDGECGQRRLQHRGEAEQFYRQRRGQPLRVGLEASGHGRWFERLLTELGHELWAGNPAAIRAAEPRKQKTDARDAEHLLKLLVEGRFPRIWLPSAEERDARQLLLHRHRLVQMRTRVLNQLQAIVLNEGLARTPGVASVKGRERLQELSLPSWTARRRQDNLALLDELLARTAPLDRAVLEQARAQPVARRLMTHPGVGPVTALAFVLTLGEAERFATGKQVASYLGLIPTEHSSGGRQRLGHISKQGNALLRGLLVEGAHIVVRHEPEWGRYYRRLAFKKHRSIAAVAVARKLAVRLWWMWKRGLDYGQMVESGSHAG